MINRSGIAGVKPYMSGTLILQSGSISISNEDFASGSVVIRGGTSESSEFSVGAAIIGSLTFSLINDSGKFSGLNWFDSRVHIYMFVDNSMVYEGEYYVVQHKEQGNIVSVECHDGLKILDEYQIYEDDITWPADSASVAQKIASRHGMYVSGLSSGIQIDDPGNDQMTERECMSLIAEIQGKYVRALGRAGGTTLSFGWYDMASVGDAGTTFSHDLRTDDVTITGVRVSTSDESKTVTRGSSGYIISISDNPFITQKNIDSIADRIGSAVIGISYRPGDVTIKSNPSIEPGDVLTVSTAKESGVKIIATTVTYKSSALTQTITSDAEPYSGDLRITRKEYIRKTTQEIIRDDLSRPDSDISNSLSSSVNHEIGNQLKDPSSDLSIATRGGMQILHIAERKIYASVSGTLIHNGVISSYASTGERIQFIIPEQYIITPNLENLPDPYDKGAPGTVAYPAYFTAQIEVQAIRENDVSTINAFRPSATIGCRVCLSESSDDAIEFHAMKGSAGTIVAYDLPRNDIYMIPFCFTANTLTGGYDSGIINNYAEYNTKTETWSPIV